MTVELYRVSPRHPSYENGDEVLVQGVIDLSADPARRTYPLWFDSEIKLNPDGSHEILTFQPSHLTVTGVDVQNRLMAIYLQAFSRSLNDSSLNILGSR